MSNTKKSLFNIKRVGLLSAGLFSLFFSVKTAYALLPDNYSDNFDNFGPNWQRSGGVFDERFYCKGGNCLKLSSGPNNGSITAQFSVLPDATYRVRAFGAVHNAAGVSRPATVEIRLDDGVDSRRVQCGDSSKSDVSVNCLGSGDPNGAFKEMKVEKKALSRTLTVNINGWAGDCNDRGCSDAYIDELFLDKIADPPQSNDNPAPTATPTPIQSGPTPTRAPQPTATPTQPTPTTGANPTPTVTVRVTPTPTVANPTPTPTSGGGQNNLQCPSGLVGIISGSMILCLQQSQQQTQTATGGSVSLTLNGAQVTATPTPIQSGPTPTSAPAQASTTKTEVAGVSNVTALPKTGLPIAAWALSGLLPAGLGIKKFGKHNNDNRNVAQYLWQEREYLKG
jgi:hypothetical protein